jgi:hypothetical protein
MQVAIADTMPRRRGRQASKPAEKTKATFYLTSDAMKRLGIAAVMENTSASALVEQLVQAGLRQYVVLTKSRAPELTLPATEDRQELGAA